LAGGGGAFLKVGADGWPSERTPHADALEPAAPTAEAAAFRLRCMSQLRSSLRAWRRVRPPAPELEGLIRSLVNEHD
jgi:hypothetical protein